MLVAFAILVAAVVAFYALREYVHLWNLSELRRKAKERRTRKQ